MSLIAKGKTYTPPPEGVWPAVCVDVVDLGIVTGQFGEKHKCRIVWEISESMDDGRPFTASKMYSVSLHEKSSLRKDLRSWRGKAFTAEELNGFDVEKVLGAQCQLVITHEEKDGIVYGNVTAVMKADRRHPLRASGEYIRFKDRPENQKNKARPSDEPQDDGDPEYDENDQLRQDLPF